MLRSDAKASDGAARLAPVVAAGAPSQVGAWNRQRGGPFAMPAVAIHSVLLPTGKVLLWGRPPGDPGAVTAGYGWLWDPVTGVSKRVDPPEIVHPDGQLKPANIWCSGQSLLADGTVLVTGGNLADQTSGSGWKGLDTAFTFNPFSETWAVQPRMRHGRWYPSQLLMGDASTLIMSGLDELGLEQMNTDVEMFTPGATSAAPGTMSLIGGQGGAGQPPIGEYYPHLFWMPSGRALVAGQHVADSWFLTPPGGSTGSFSWTDGPNLSRGRFFGNAVLLPGGPAGSTKVLELGGADLPDTAAPDSETFDEQTSAWSPAPSQNIGRGHANTVLLPGGSMVTVGGGLGQGPNGLYDATEDQKQVEIYDPGTGTWRLGPAQQQRRTYHSTALLLPDARVLSAGDDAPEAGVANSGRYLDDAEIYEPPYLFDGDGSLASRPQISQAPASVRWGTPFAVRSPSADITRAVLIAPGAATHANDMQQRHVELAITQNYPGTGVNVVSPPSADVAPPGYYMLFLLNSHGVPSIARFIRLDPAAPTPEVLAPPDTRPPAVAIPPAVARPPLPAARPTCLGKTAMIVPVAGQKVITGTSGPDVIVGRDAGERIDGRGGNDLICAGKGNDKLHGGTGKDRLVGGHGNDLLLGGAGNDDLRGGDGNDHTGGGDGRDRVDGGAGNDLFDEQKLGDKGRDRLFGGAGADRVRTADATRNEIDCGPGRDSARIDRLDGKKRCEAIRVT